MNIGIICPSEIAFRRFMPALEKLPELHFAGIGVGSKEEWFGEQLPAEETIEKILGEQRKKAQEFIDNLELFSLIANVADVKSLAIHPASTTHSECNEAELLDQGIKPNTIRLSIGTENIADIIEDLDEAFKAIQ